MKGKESASSTHSSHFRAIADLITHSESTIASSQATVHTNHSQKTSYSQSLETWTDLENYEDIIG